MFSSPASVILVLPRSQAPELCQGFEVFQSPVGNLGVAEIQRSEFRQAFELFRPGIHVRVFAADINPNNLCEEIDS